MERSKPLKSFERNTGTETQVGENSLTKQSFTEDCDINVIMRRHLRTGLIEHINPRQPTYGDYSQARTLHEALELVSEAQDEFMTLPAEVRSMVQNSPERLLQALSDPEETAALAAAGLPMAEGWQHPDYMGEDNDDRVSSAQQKPEPPAFEENQAEDSGAITGGE